jgi:uncharacterized membrane protein YphA (DoxX/SURF4 family)
MLLAATFIKSGTDAFIEPGDRVSLVEQAGLSNPKVAVELNGVAMAVGGTMLALVPTTVVGHAFWKAENETERQRHLINFLKNAGLIGGLLLVLCEKKE